MSSRLNLRSPRGPNREGNATILVKFNIPQDAANGVHTSKIWVNTTPAQEGEGGMVVPLKISSEVEIEATGTQILTGEAKSITIRDAPQRLLEGQFNTLLRGQGHHVLR